MVHRASSFFTTRPAEELRSPSVGGTSRCRLGSLCAQERTWGRLACLLVWLDTPCARPRSRDFPTTGCVQNIFSRGPCPETPRRPNRGVKPADIFKGTAEWPPDVEYRGFGEWWCAQSHANRSRPVSRLRTGNFRVGPPRSETQSHGPADHREGHSYPPQGELAGVVERTPLTSSGRFDLFWRLQFASDQPTEVIRLKCERQLRAMSGLTHRGLAGRGKCTEPVAAILTFFDHNPC
jgi:hypothetical protein